jgi:hypothetical protein
MVFNMASPNNIFIPIVRGLAVTILAATLLCVFARIFFPEIMDTATQENIDNSANNLIGIAVWGISILLGIFEALRVWKKQFRKLYP